jgi:hypothetical protein
LLFLSGLLLGGVLSGGFADGVAGCAWLFGLCTSGDAKLRRFSNSFLSESIDSIWEVDVGGGALEISLAITCNPLMILLLVETLGIFR